MVGLFLTKLRRDINRGRKQFVAVVVTVFLGVMLFGASFDAYQNLVDSYDQMFVDLAFADLTVSGGDVDVLIEQSQSLAGIEATETRTQADVPFRINGSHKLRGRLIGMPPDEQPAVDRVDILEGEYLSSSIPNGVLVEQHMANEFDLQEGGQLEIQQATDGSWHEVTVVGIVASAEYLWPARSRQDIFPAPDEFGVMFAAEALTHDLAGVSGVRQALFRYETDADAAALDAQLTELARQIGATAVVRGEEQPSNEILKTDIDGFQEMAFMFPILFLTAAGMGTYVLANRIVHSQRAYIGMLRANGVGRQPLFLHYLSYGILIGLLGALPGAIAGVILARWITRLYLSALSIPTIVDDVHVLTPVIGILFGLLMGALATIAPALTAFRMRPVEAMRGPAPVGTGQISLIERIIPPLQRLPSRWKMVFRSITRSRRRSISTIVGVILALTLVLVSWGMLDTIQILVDRQFNEIEVQDATVFYSMPVGSDQLTSLNEVAGVADVEPFVEVPVSIRAGDSSYETALRAMEPDTMMHTFINTNGATIHLPSTGILAGSALQGELDLKTGENVSIFFPSLDRTIEEPVEAFLDEPLGTYVYMSLPALSEALTGTTSDIPVNAALVRYVPEANGDEVRQLLGQQPGVVSVQDASYLADTLDQFMALFYVFVGIMLVFGGLMAFALIFNMMSVNISERSVEIASMQASGVRQRSISEMLVSENLILVALGTIPGLIVGYIVAWGFMASFSSDLFQFNLQMRTSTLFFSALIMIVIALISLWPGLRFVRRINLGQVMRERAT